MIRVGSEEERRRILQNEWKLKREEVWIEENLTWEEKRIKWRIRHEGGGEGKRMKMGQRRIWIEGSGMKREKR